MASSNCTEQFNRTEAARLVGTLVRQKEDSAIGMVTRMSIATTRDMGLFFTIIVDLFGGSFSREVHCLSKCDFNAKFNVVPPGLLEGQSSYSWLRSLMKRFPGAISGDFSSDSGLIKVDDAMNAVDIGLIVLSVFELTGGRPVHVSPFI